MPFPGAPLVMNQKIAPSVADCVGSLDNAGMFATPWPLSPWHNEHFLA